MSCSRQFYRALGLVMAAIAAAAVAQERERRAPPESSRPEGPAERPARVRTEPVRPEPLQNAKTTIVALRYAPADHAAKVLAQVQQAVGQRFEAIPDSRSNSLVVISETDEQLKLVQDLVSALDHDLGGGAAESFGVRMVVLQSARANEAAQVVMQMLVVQRPVGLRVCADERSNTVWVSGPRPAMDDAINVLTQLEESTSKALVPEARGRELQFYQIKNADTVRLAKTVRAVMGAMGTGVEIVPDPETATLIAHVTPAEHAQLEKIIVRLDQTPAHPAAEPSRQP